MLALDRIFTDFLFILISSIQYYLTHVSPSVVCWFILIDIFKGSRKRWLMINFREQILLFLGCLTFQQLARYISGT